MVPRHHPLHPQPNKLTPKPRHVADCGICDMLERCEAPQSLSAAVHGAEQLTAAGARPSASSE